MRASASCRLRSPRRPGEVSQCCPLDFSSACWPSACWLRRWLRRWWQLVKWPRRPLPLLRSIAGPPAHGLPPLAALLGQVRARPCPPPTPALGPCLGLVGGGAAHACSCAARQVLGAPASCRRRHDRGRAARGMPPRARPSPTFAPPPPHARPCHAGLERAQGRGGAARPRRCSARAGGAAVHRRRCPRRPSRRCTAFGGSPVLAPAAWGVRLLQLPCLSKRGKSASRK